MSSYCSKCGKELESGIRFCPDCGFDTMSQGSEKNYNSSSYGQNSNPQYSNQSQSLGGTLTITFVLGILWVIFSIIAGVSCIAGGGIFFFFGGVVLVIVGVLCLLSGLFVALACINIYKLENYEQACTYWLIGSLIGLVTSVIIGGVIGIILYFLMKKERSRFKS